MGPLRLKGGCSERLKRHLFGLMECQALDGGVWEEKEKEGGGGEKGSREEGGGRLGLSITLSCFTWPFLSRTTWQNPGEVE